MEGVTLKDYLIKDDQLFTDFISKQGELYDTAQIDLHSKIFSLNDLFPNNYEKHKFYLKKYYTYCRDAIKPHILLEYFTMQGDREEVEAILKSEREFDSPEMTTWISIYSILSERKEGLLSGTNLIDAIFEVKNTNNETLILSLIIHLYGISETGLYEPFHKVRRVVKPMVEYMDNDFLRESYSIRLAEMEVITYLYMNKIDLCREKSLEVIERSELEVYFPVTYAVFYHLMGQSFTFENFEAAKYWIEKSMAIVSTLPPDYRDTRMIYLINTMDFLHSYWGINLDVEPYDEAELAHRYIVTGRAEESVEILDKLKKENGYLTSYQLFFYGIATDDEKLLQVARDVFISNSNYFYLQLLKPENVQRYKARLRGE